MDERVNTEERQEVFWFLDTRVEVLIASSTGEDRLSVLRHRAPFGDSPPLHVHETEDEIFQVLNGTFRFRIDGNDRLVQAGEVILAPKSVPHTYCVESRDGGAWITVTARGDFEGLVRDLARPAEDAGLPARHGKPTQAEVAALTAACADHKIAIVGPPLVPSS